MSSARQGVEPRLVQSAVMAAIRNEWFDVIVGQGSGCAVTREAIENGVWRLWGAPGAALVKELKAADVERAALVSAANGSLIIDAADTQLNALGATFAARLESAAVASRALPKSVSQQLAKSAAALIMDSSPLSTPPLQPAQPSFLRLPPHVTLTAVTTSSELHAAARRAHAFAAKVRRAARDKGVESTVDAFIAVDTESRPSLSSFVWNSCRVSIAQIFVCSPPGVGPDAPEGSEVILVDMPRLVANAKAGGKAGQAALRGAVTALFAPTAWELDAAASVAAADPHLARPPSFCTLIFGASDIQQLSAAHPSFSDVFRAPAAIVVDVQKLAAPVGGTRGNDIGLSSLCCAVLGGPLEKKWRMSDWARRPLLPVQATYAAIDAWVLPQLARALLPIDDAGCFWGGDRKGRLFLNNN